MSKNRKKEALKIYRDFYLKNQGTFLKILQSLQEQNKKIAIWGAGLKGIAFLACYDEKSQKISYVIDNNQTIWNSNLETGHLIISPEKMKEAPVDAVLLMNSNYETEIAGKLREMQQNVLLLNIDSIIWGNLDFEEVKELYGKRLLTND